MAQLLECPAAEVQSSPVVELPPNWVEIAPLPQPAPLSVVRDAVTELEHLRAGPAQGEASGLWWLLRRLAAAQASTEEARAVQDLRELLRHVEGKR